MSTVVRRFVPLLVGILGLPLVVHRLGFAQDSVGPADLPSAVIRVMTSNVRYGTADDGENAWEHRKAMLLDVMRTAEPDLIGTQEILPFQADYLQQGLADYVYVGRSRELDNVAGEQCGVFYRRDRFVELERGYFWLSQHPEQPGSQSWDAALPRMATWLKLFDRKRQRVFVVINTHFDHRGGEARLQSARLLLDYARRFAADYPLLVTGDFNCGEASPPYLQLVRGPSEDSSPLIDVYRQANATRNKQEGTFNGFEGRRDGPRIDWILATPQWRVLSANILTTQTDGRTPSDHFPVVATLEY